MMTSIATTRLSSKGQVVIPEEIRRTLKLHIGDQFVVLGDKDVVIFKIIKAPPRQEFASLVMKARKEAQYAGLTKSDVVAAIKKARRSK
jgi:AbrB family looped-hinge helix DNA binding protein